MSVRTWLPQAWRSDLSSHCRCEEISCLGVTYLPTLPSPLLSAKLPLTLQNPLIIDVFKAFSDPFSLPVYIPDIDFWMGSPVS
jgi:hypothetical protein